VHVHPRVDSRLDCQSRGVVVVRIRRILASFVASVLRGLIIKTQIAPPNYPIDRVAKSPKPLNVEDGRVSKLQIIERQISNSKPQISNTRGSDFERRSFRRDGFVAAASNVKHSSSMSSKKRAAGESVTDRELPSKIENLTNEPIKTQVDENAQTIVGTEH
jgi:hypothetical protein